MRFISELEQIVPYEPGAPLVKTAVDKVRQPFKVNRLAQIAALEALCHQDQVDLRRRQNAQVRRYMVDRLTARGRVTVPSEANFMLVDTRDLCKPQDEVCSALMSMGAIVRDGNALGCSGWARVSVGTKQEVDFFLAKLGSLDPASLDDKERRSS
jgi:histidinol-phosphate aminotransferase